MILYPSSTAFGADAVEHMTTQDRLVASDRLSLNGKLYEDVEQLYVHAGMMDVPTLAGGDPRPQEPIYCSVMVELSKTLRNSNYNRPGFLHHDILGAHSRSRSDGITSQIRNAAADPLARLKRDGVVTPPGTDTAFF